MQLELFDAPEGPSEQPRKEVRAISRAQIYELKDSGKFQERITMVLNGLAHHYYQKQFWPTPAELTRHLFKTKRIPAENRNVVAPRLSDLVNGPTQRVKREDGTSVQVRTGGGVCELLEKRRCRVTGTQAHPIRIREAGSVLARFGYVK